MKKNEKKIITICVVLLVTHAFTGCVTLTPETVPNFNLFNGQYNRLKPLEEQCILICLSPESGFKISEIDGMMITPDGRWLKDNEIIIVQPGQRNIKWEYSAVEMTMQQQWQIQVHGWGSYTTVTGSNTFTFNFEPGEYYYFSGERNNKSVSLSIRKISEANQIIAYIPAPMSISWPKVQLINSDAILKGIDIQIKKFEKRKPDYVFNKKIPFDQQAILYPFNETQKSTA